MIALAVAQIVSQAPVAAPAVQVVHDTVVVTKTVPALSATLVTGLMLAGLAIAGWLMSRLHEVFEGLSKRTDGWSRGVNIVLQVLVGLVVSAVASYINHTLTLSWASAEDFVGQFLIVFGSSQGRYTFFKWVRSLGTSSESVSPVLDAAPAEPVIPVKAAV